MTAEVMTRDASLVRQCVAERKLNLCSCVCFVPPSTDDLLSELDWMAERVDLSEFDLDSLIGSCSPSEEPPSSPEDFLASLDCPMELDSLPMSLSAPVFSGVPPSPAFHVSPPASPFTPPPTISSDQTVVAVDGHESYVNEQNVPSPPVCVPEPQEELEIKSEPTSPEPASPTFNLPPSPAYTLDLGSEVDVSESEVKPAVSPVIPQVQRLVLSLSPTRIVLVLAPKEDASVATTTTAAPEVLQASPPQRSCRSRPYPEPKCKGSPPSPSSSSGVKVKPLPSAAASDDRAPLKPTKTKKLKKMEQNKTAATRYRQKKKSEKEDLLKEYTVLERKNMELTEKADSMAREIAYLKELMEEVRQARINKVQAVRP